jgi:hypothetical protein
MLAYVFWHAPVSEIELAGYDALLLRFHAALAANPPTGFRRSFSTRTSRLPWLDADAGYEDWYLIADSAGLDPLDAAAVDARRRGVHDAAAQVARTGAGGLYRLVYGAPIEPAQTVWFAKPVGRSYAQFAPVLDGLRREGSVLLQRQMVLGPAPEYALQTQNTTADAVGIRVVHETLRASETPPERRTG